MYLRLLNLILKLQNTKSDFANYFIYNQTLTPPRYSPVQRHMQAVKPYSLETEVRVFNENVICRRGYVSQSYASDTIPPGSPLPRNRRRSGTRIHVLCISEFADPHPVQKINFAHYLRIHALVWG